MFGTHEAFAVGSPRTVYAAILLSRIFASIKSSQHLLTTLGWPDNLSPGTLAHRDGQEQYNQQVLPDLAGETGSTETTQCHDLSAPNIVLE